MSLDLTLYTTVNVGQGPEDITMASFNITHNLTDMAQAAGIYHVLWRPEECGIQQASQLVTPLQEGLAILESNPDAFHEFDPCNGWGSYEGFIIVVYQVLQACKDRPHLKVKAFR